MVAWQTNQLFDSYSHTYRQDELKKRARWSAARLDHGSNNRVKTFRSESTNIDDFEYEHEDGMDA